MKSSRRSIFKKTVVHAPQAISEAYKYEYPSLFSRGIKLELNDITLFFISGTASVDSRGRSIHINNFKAQCQRAFENVDSLLISNGATWKDIIKTTIFLKSMKFYKKFNEARSSFFKKKNITIYPASICVEAKLCRKELLVEIEAIAILKNKRRI